MAGLPGVLAAGAVELRRCGLGDLDALMRAIEVSQLELARWLPWADPMPTVEAERAFLLERQRCFDADEDWGYFLIESGTGELVGGAGLHRRERGVVEIGYWVRTDRTRRGYATAAAGALTSAAFAHLSDVDRVTIRIDQGNGASAAVPPKLGYRLDGEDPLREIIASGHTGKGWIWVRTRSS
jgi:RimJ/RimL family protein N-acetyltransferase